MIDEKQVRERAAKMVESIGDKVEASGFSLRKVLERSGVEQSTYFRWKNDPPETLLKLAAIDIAAEQLVAENPPA